MADDDFDLPDMSDLPGGGGHEGLYGPRSGESMRQTVTRAPEWTNSQVIDLSGGLWLVGMDWESREAPQSNSQIRARAREIGADMAVQRIVDGAVQVGYGFPIEGLKPAGNIRSLAASVAQGVKQPWLGIYQLDEERYWYVAVRDGFQIMPGSDIVADRETVDALRREHRGLSGDWTQKEGTLEHLELLIDQFATRSPKVWFLNRSKRPLYLTIATCCLVLAGGYFAYRHHIDAVREARQAAIARLEAERARLAHHPLELPPSPVVRLPMPDSVTKTCMSLIGQVPVSIDGWTVADLSCTNDTATVGWKRTDGATLAAMPRGEISPDGNTIVNTVKLPVPQESRNDTVILSVAIADLRIYLQSAGVERSSVIIHIPPVKKRDLYQRAVSHKPPPIPPPPTATVSFVWPVSPTGTAWNRIPGFRITSIIHEQKGWKIGGTIYGKRPPITDTAS
ncbi:MAG: type 4b pilus protein PilO2 [Betaproteobacteria bacterium]|uniref:type 4b pilus protein PilO2 n=1 Tax=Acidiphilium multivorum TaxID=62140 RepID=UPI001F4C4AFB|nr:type 4b pilus protein PilO2 [Acidiphilium multivorum]MDE2343658.1 type 4b pilus protein PilO2 [Betaproteobacteria bacterium]UNC16192.1 hypothetical protein FE249_18220 [Acidiphilium multivorum]